MTPTVTLEPQLIDYAENRQDYDGAVDALSALGYSVDVRFKDGNRDFVGLAAELVVYLGEHVADAGLAVLLETIFKRLRMRPSEDQSSPAKTRRRFVLVDSEGKVLRETELERVE